MANMKLAIFDYLDALPQSVADTLQIVKSNPASYLFKYYNIQLTTITTLLPACDSVFTVNGKIIINLSSVTAYLSTLASDSLFTLSSPSFISS